MTSTPVTTKPGGASKDTIRFWSGRKATPPTVEMPTPEFFSAPHMANRTRKGVGQLSRTRFGLRAQIIADSKDDSKGREKAKEAALKIVYRRTSKFIRKESFNSKGAARANLREFVKNHPDDPSYLPVEMMDKIDEMRWLATVSNDPDRLQTLLFDWLEKNDVEAFNNMSAIYEVAEAVPAFPDLGSIPVSPETVNLPASVAIEAVQMDPEHYLAASSGLALAVPSFIPPPVPSVASGSKSPNDSPKGGVTPQTPPSDSYPSPAPSSTPSSLASMPSVGSSAGTPCTPLRSPAGSDHKYGDADEDEGDETDTGDDKKHDEVKKLKVDPDIPKQEEHDNYPNSNMLGPDRDGVVNRTGDAKGQFGYSEFKAQPDFEGDHDGVGHDDEGDFFRDVQTHDPDGKATLRPRFGMENASDVIPSAKDQILSDLRFDMFDTVNAGFGEGEDNKLFLMDQNRDTKIVYADPMFAPGVDIGPEAGVGVTTWKLQRTIPTEKMADYELGLRRQMADMSELVLARDRAETTNLLGDDIGFDRSYSSKGLKRTRGSIFAPIVSNEMEFSRVKMPTGAELNGYDFRRETDAMRYPRHLSSNTNGMGGPTLNKRRSLALIRE
tara:strand:+ start:226 stop:2052 length:1827 start_codon:yes stop_codon:yes gene_type:complete